MNNVLKDDVALMLAKSRTQAGKSQQEIANLLGVSKSTIQKWESGYCCPSLISTLEWFDALGVSMYPYLMGLLYPAEIAGITANTDMNKLKQALHKCVDELDDLHARELLYLLYGSHGSSPTGTLDVTTTYLHLPLAMRVCITNNMLMNYQVAQSQGWIRDDEHVIPKLETLERYLNTAKDAVLSNKESYTLVFGETSDEKSCAIR